MNTMAKVLEKEWNSYFMQLDETEKKSVLQMVKTFLKGRGENSARISIEQYNKEIEESEKQIEAGNFITQEQLEKEMKQW